MSDRQQRVDDFVKAFYRESAPVADSLELDLSPAEMREVRERLVYLVLKELASSWGIHPIWTNYTKTERVSLPLPRGAKDDKEQQTL